MTTNWNHGKPVRGFFGGLVIGIGGLLILHQFGLIVLELPLVIVIPLLMAAGGAVRGWFGTPYL